MGSGGYVICEYDSVKEDFPEFQSVLDALHVNLLAKAEADWSPLKFDRDHPMAPRAGYFGESTIIPSLFEDRVNVTLVTWEQWYDFVNKGMTIPGNNVIMQGANGGNMYEDYKVGLAGLVFLDKAIRISEIKMQISDKKLPRINIEEALAYNKPAIVFEDGYILDEETGFELQAYATTPGPQSIKLLGFQLNRVKDKLFTNAGSPLV